MSLSEVLTAKFYDVHFGKTQPVVVESDVLPYVKTTVHGNTLTVSVDAPKRYSKAKLHITIPKLKSADLSGASELECKGVNETKVCRITASGASSVKYKGDPAILDVNTSGASRVVKK